MNIGDIYVIRPKEEDNNNNIDFTNFKVLVTEINYNRHIVSYTGLDGWEGKSYIDRFLQIYEFNEKLTDEHTIRDIIE